MGMTVMKMRITCKHKCDRNLCELWIVECALLLAFEWLIVLRSAIKTRDETHRVLKTRLPRPKTRTKNKICAFARLVRVLWAEKFGDCLYN